MSERSHVSLKIGLLIVSIALFLFSFHELFKAAVNITEYASIASGHSIMSNWILITDVSGVIGLIFRTIAGITAIAAVSYYIAKKGLPMPTTLKFVRWILIAEAIYWLSIFVAGLWWVLPANLAGFGESPALIGSGDLKFNLGFMIEGGIPVLAGAIGIPVALFKLVLELRPNKPLKGAIKWGLIAGAVYVFIFWFNNVGNWIYAIMRKGTELLTIYPENLLSFILGSIALLALTIYTAYFARKSIGTETVDTLNLKAIGAIIVVLGLVYLWNYLTWIYFGNNQLWATYTDWYAWFLGHHMDLWLLTIPLVGLPIIFERKTSPLAKK